MSNLKRTNIYLPAELLGRMRAIAQGRSVAAMVREAIILWLSGQEKLVQQQQQQ